MQEENSNFLLLSDNDYFIGQSTAVQREINQLWKYALIQSQKLPSTCEIKNQQ